MAFSILISYAKEGHEGFCHLNGAPQNFGPLFQILMLMVESLRHQGNPYGCLRESGGFSRYNHPYMNPILHMYPNTGTYIHPPTPL